MGTSFANAGQINAHYGSSDAWVAHADANGNFINGKTLGGGADGGDMIYPLDGGLVLAGGIFRWANHSFEGLNVYGSYDVFLATLAPWSVGVQEVAYSSIGIFPNPVRGQLHINAVAGGSITIMDVSGRQQYTAGVDGQPLTVDVSAWQRGTYIVQHTLQDGSRVAERLVVE